MSVKLTAVFFNRDKHLGALSENWIYIQCRARKRTESVAYWELLR
jgi:hypothetical protein